MSIPEIIARGVGAGAIAALLAWSSPDPMVPIDEFTPGVVASTDPAEVCGIVGGITYSERHRATRYDKSHSMMVYGLDVTRPDKYEYDHRIPLCVGGADVPDNMWPQPLAGHMNAHDKYELEKWACRAVCLEHSISLPDAQAMFFGDWRDAFNRVFG